MNFRIATTLFVAAALTQACGSEHGRDGWGMEGGGGKPRPFVNVQKLQPVTIEGVNPAADPKPRFSMAVCTQSPCNVTVQVDAACNISMDPQYMGLRYSNPSMDFTLVFKLQSSNGHAFSNHPDPIDWKNLGGNLPDVDVKSAQEVWVTFRSAQQARRFLYGIVVDDASGKQCGELDPGVIPDL